MKKNTTVNKIANLIREEITSSKLKSGEHLKEAELSKKFKVSRVPVREAFRILQSEGYIDVIPNRGSFVKKISKEYVLETSRVYRLLAPVMLEKAIPKYNSKTFEKAERIIRRVEKSRNFSETGYLLWDFAKIIYSPSKMKYLLSIFDEIYNHNIRLLNEFFENKEYAVVNVNAQRAFIDLCRKNKKDEAIKHWLEYIDVTIERLLPAKKK